MKRIHIHIGVDNLEQSIGFYSALFNATPTKTKTDYAKWLLDDPSINFAISTRAGETGFNHLGLQVDDDAELEELRERFKRADISVFDEGETVCCYARSEKTWIQDPAGITWEAYKTMGDAQFFDDNGPAQHESGNNPPAATDTAQGRPPKTAAGCC